MVGSAAELFGEGTTVTAGLRNGVVWEGHDFEKI
jgi:hypothetical protein